MPAVARAFDPNCPACRGRHRKRTCDPITAPVTGGGEHLPQVELPALEPARPVEDMPRERPAEAPAEPVLLPPPPVPEPPPGDEVNKQRLLAKARSRLVERMRDDATLRSLHLKHYHMSFLQFRCRTSHLGLPPDVFERFERIVKTCEYCMKTKPAPQRSRVSGLRSEVFGDLVFLDHGQVRVHSLKFLFLIILDGATGFTAAYPQTTLEPE